MEGEIRVCRVHDCVMTLRPDGFHCEECKKLAADHGMILAACPHCHETLLVPRPEIDGLPSANFLWCYEDEFQFDGVHMIWVSAKRDSFKKISVPPIMEFAGKLGPALRLSCPYCMKALPLAPRNSECRLCGARVVMIHTKYPKGEDGFGTRWVCSRHGCPGHHFGEEDISVGADIGLEGHLLSAMARGGFTSG